ncbi:MAG TPA: MBL fold metallo-hydrolase [bacterium]|nr:MBL fold metallo-hydrolase [Arthrobacter sp. SDTb3-6]NVM98642.1 MBL fold metallo-hydrolase [Arthrobacter sp. SDTb3-6]HET9870496.1 MBL fold metallo-hydrolase [bacterium]
MVAGVSALNPRVVTLGTAGGPMWWTGQGAGARSGIATAVLVKDRCYLVDCGHGVGRQLMLAGIGISSISGIFLTHLHSDHTIDLGSLAIFGLYDLKRGDKIKLMGPGDRGMLPRPSGRPAEAPVPVFPDRPTPGTVALFDAILGGYATDLNDRIFDTLRPSPYDFLDVEDIALPEGIGYHPNDNPAPDMEPFEIFSDELVTVTAILVRHAPVAPAFAFRFDTAEGSVTISGDTGRCGNVVRLARNTDLLLHEAIDLDWVHRDRPGVPAESLQAAIDHHTHAHTSVADCVAVATEAGAKALALHHLVPGTAPKAVWWRGAGGFAGEYLVPDDLEEISFAGTATRG